MKKELEALLVSAEIEQCSSNMDYAIFGFKHFLSILKKSTDVFDEVPMNIYVSSEELSKTDSGIITTGLEKDLSTNFGKDIKKTIEFYDSKGILLYDNIYASAFGQMSYIYRAKGLRIYLLENSKIIVVTPYCYIDHNGFSLVQEEVDSFFVNYTNLEETIGNLRMYLDIKDESFNRKLIEILISIKETFQKAYYLEYLFPPPDVNIQSKFSTQIKYDLWDICLSDSFEKTWKVQMQENGMSFLLQLGITPPSELIVGYLKKGNSSYEELQKKIDNLERILTKKDDIFEFKPNWNGIGFNFNEIFSRLKERFGNK